MSSFWHYWSPFWYPSIRKCGPTKKDQNSWMYGRERDKLFVQAHEGLEPSCISSSSPTQTPPHDTLESVLYLFLRKYNAGCLVLLFLQVLQNNNKMKYLKCSNKAGFCYLIYYHVPIVNMKLLFCKPRTQFVLLLYINKDYWIKKQISLNLQINRFFFLATQVQNNFGTI